MGGMVVTVISRTPKWRRTQCNRTFAVVCDLPHYNFQLQCKIKTRTGIRVGPA
jgi:hypothetical protein